MYPLSKVPSVRATNSAGENKRRSLDGNRDGEMTVSAGLQRNSAHGAPGPFLRSFFASSCWTVYACCRRSHQETTNRKADSRRLALRALQGRNAHRRTNEPGYEDRDHGRSVTKRCPHSDASRGKDTAPQSSPSFCKCLRLGQQKWPSNERLRARVRRWQRQRTRAPFGRCGRIVAQIPGRACTGSPRSCAPLIPSRKNFEEGI